MTIASGMPNSWLASSAFDDLVRPAPGAPSASFAPLQLAAHSVLDRVERLELAQHLGELVVEARAGSSP
jgi:hypothetical protein